MAEVEGYHSLLCEQVQVSGPYQMKYMGPKRLEERVISITYYRISRLYIRMYVVGPCKNRTYRCIHQEATTDIEECITDEYMNASKPALANWSKFQ